MVGRLQRVSSLPARVAVAFIRVYQRFISPLLGDHCRYCPSCSQYALEAFARHGFFKGLMLAVCRLLRCGPWSPGGYDPVPERASRDSDAAEDRADQA